MKKHLLSLALIVTPLAYAQGAARMRVVATIPDLADIAGRVGGELVEIDRLARGTEDIHQIAMRPSFVAKLNRAKAVVYLGMTAEHSFLPGLLEAAANPSMRGDFVETCVGPGCINCSEGVDVLDRPATVSRAEGEIHPEGNPHYNVSPDNGVLIARNIAKGLSRLAPEHAAAFEKNLAAYLAELAPKLAELRKAAAPLKGVKAVSYHKDVAYLGRFTGIEFVGTIEYKPGIAPTPTHLTELVKRMRAENVKLIVREQQYERKTCEWLAAQTGAKIAVVATMANALPGTETFVAFSQRNLEALLSAVGKK